MTPLNIEPGAIGGPLGQAASPLRMDQDHEFTIEATGITISGFLNYYTYRIMGPSPILIIQKL